MIERALLDWRLEEIDLLLIENVGNLVAPRATIWASPQNWSFSASPKERTSR